MHAWYWDENICKEEFISSFLVTRLSATLSPYAAHVYFNRANLFASLRKYKEAEEDYTRGDVSHFQPEEGRGRGLQGRKLRKTLGLIFLVRSYKTLSVKATVV